MILLISHRSRDRKIEARRLKREKTSGTNTSGRAGIKNDTKKSRPALVLPNQPRDICPRLVVRVRVSASSLYRGNQIARHKFRLCAVMRVKATTAKLAKSKKAHIMCPDASSRLCSCAHRMCSRLVLLACPIRCETSTMEAPPTINRADKDRDVSRDFSVTSGYIGILKLPGKSGRCGRHH